jgi:hypothetical protein
MTTYLDVVAAVGEEAALGEAAVRRRFVGAMEIEYSNSNTTDGLPLLIPQIKMEWNTLRSSLSTDPPYSNWLQLQ